MANFNISSQSERQLHCRPPQSKEINPVYWGWGDGRVTVTVKLIGYLSVHVIYVYNSCLISNKAGTNWIQNATVYHFRDDSDKRNCKQHVSVVFPLSFYSPLIGSSLASCVHQTGL